MRGAVLSDLSAAQLTPTLVGAEWLGGVTARRVGCCWLGTAAVGKGVVSIGEGESDAMSVDEAENALWWRR